MKITRRRLFFAATLAVGLVFTGVVGWRIHRAWQNHRVKVWVQSYGGSISWPEAPDLRTPQFLQEWLGEPVLDDIATVSISGSLPISLGEVGDLANLPKLKFAFLDVTGFGDEHVEILCRSRSIEFLSLSDSAISDHSLKMISTRMPQIASLNLSRTSITGEGLRHLSHLIALEQLYLSDTTIGDAELEWVCSHSNLNVLHVGESVTDASIPKLAELKKLRFLTFMRSPVTDAGVDSLINALPQLQFTLIDTRISEKKYSELWKAGKIAAAP